VDRDGLVVAIGLLDADSVTALLAPMSAAGASSGGTASPAAPFDARPERMDAARVRRALARRAYLLVADALPDAEQDAVALARHDPDLAGFAAVWAPREAELARRALLAQQRVIGKRGADVDVANWRKLRCSGVNLTVCASPDSAISRSRRHATSRSYATER